ncbi:helix-turn-helix domain-containing protein [Streptomyces sp. NPDC005423]|uniref:helix-turn-helix transcriptional regulator n=1 Tax=Streptomyces sp. NPDC005423 TaxID=3155343 RepID=UPI0033AA7002
MVRGDGELAGAALPVNVKGAAEYLGLSPHTLYVWRHRRQGPPSFRMGQHGRVMYRLEALQSWVREHSASLHWPRRRPLHTTHENGLTQRPAVPTRFGVPQGEWGTLRADQCSQPGLQRRGFRRSTHSIAGDRPHRSAAHSPRILPRSLGSVVGARDPGHSPSRERLPGRLLRASPSA